MTLHTNRNVEAKGWGSRKHPRICISFEEADFVKLRRLAAGYGMPTSAVVRDAVRAFLMQFPERKDA
jgi:hypothetical protein